MHLGYGAGGGPASADHRGAEGMGYMQLVLHCVHLHGPIRGYGQCATYTMCVHESIVGPVLCNSTGH